MTSRPPRSTSSKRTRVATSGLKAADVFSSNYRVRPKFRDAVLRIAERAAAFTADWEGGDHRASWTNRCWAFLDGQVVDSHDIRSGGLWVSGNRVRRFILYAVGAAQPRRWKGEAYVPKREQLEWAVAHQKVGRDRSADLARWIANREHAITGERGALVVGVVFEQVIVMPEDTFLGHRALHDKVAARSWGRLRRYAPELMAEIDGRFDDPFDDREEDRPGDRDPVDMMDVPGAQDGDWPFFAQDMAAWLPPEICKEFGTITATSLNGDYLQIEPKRAKAFITALEAHGYACRRDDKGVLIAGGG